MRADDPADPADAWYFRKCQIGLAAGSKPRHRRSYALEGGGDVHVPDHAEDHVLRYVHAPVMGEQVRSRELTERGGIPDNGHAGGVPAEEALGVCVPHLPPRIVLPHLLLALNHPVLALEVLSRDLRAGHPVCDEVDAVHRLPCCCGDVVAGVIERRICVGQSADFLDAPGGLLGLTCRRRAHVVDGALGDEVLGEMTDAGPAQRPLVEAARPHVGPHADHGCLMSRLDDDGQPVGERHDRRTAVGDCAIDDLDRSGGGGAGLARRRLGGWLRLGYGRSRDGLRFDGALLA